MNAAPDQALQALWDERLHIALGMEYLSASALQRQMRMRHADACMLLDVLQAHGVVEPVQVFAVRHTLADWRTRMPGLDGVEPHAIAQMRRGLERDFRQNLLADVMPHVRGNGHDF